MDRLKMKLYDEEKIKTIKKFIVFCSVGIIGLVFNYSIFFILYRYLNVYYLLSSVIGYILSIFVAFYLHRKYSFKIKTTTKIKYMAFKYILVTSFSLILNISLLIILVEIIKTNVYMANFMVLVLIAIINFNGSQLFVFSEKPDSV